MFIFLVLGIEPKTLWILGKCSITEPHPQPSTSFDFFPVVVQGNGVGRFCALDMASSLGVLVSSISKGTKEFVWALKIQLLLLLQIPEYLLRVADLCISSYWEHRFKARNLCQIEETSWLLVLQCSPAVYILRQSWGWAVCLRNL